jgi:sporulation protein YlmC with PRC-barrel domain
LPQIFEKHPMISKLIFASTLVYALCGCPKTSAQTNQPDGQRDHQDIANIPTGAGEKGSKILGIRIKDSEDEKLGKVDDLAVDLQNGRIVEVIVSLGGVLGVGKQFAAVPPNQFSFDKRKNELLISQNALAFKSAALMFKMSDWDSVAQASNVARVYQYYGIKPYFYIEGQPSQDQVSVSNRLGQVQRVSKLIGMVILNERNQRVGKVHNLILDLQAGRVVEVILAPGDFLETGSKLYAVPPQALHFGIERDTLFLKPAKHSLSRDVEASNLEGG